MASMRTSAGIAAIALAGTMLAGCVGGTTYGTGVSQERQTVEDLANILTVKKRRPDIEYQPRPDLVVPEQKQLVQPGSNDAASDVDWPESPEARLARVRQEAEDAQATTASQNRFSRSQKNVRGVAPGSGVQLQSAPIGQGVPNVSCSPNAGDDLLRPCTPGEISNSVREARNEIRSVGKTGYQRRYLTEPPLEYRTPSDDAPLADAYTEKELQEIQAEEKRKRWRALTHPGN